MAGAHHREIIDSVPSRRPLGQGFWLVATMAIAAVILTSMGDSLRLQSASAADGSLPERSLPDRAPGESTTELLTPPAGTRRSLEVTVPSGLIAAPSTFDQAATADLSLPERRGLAALDLISYPWEELLPEWQISFLDGKEGLYGLTLVPEKRIEIYVRDSQSETLLAHVIAHELGHAIDVSLNNGRERRRWEEARGLGGEPWWPGSGATDFSTGAGDFAESFAAWQVGDESFRSNLAGPPTPAQIQLLAELAAG